MIELENKQYKLGHFTVDCQSNAISYDGETVVLPVKVFQLLKLFISEPSHQVDVDKAIERIWQGNVGVGKRGFTNAMWHLRKSFSDLDNGQLEVFRTIRKVGYVLLIEPESESVKHTPVQAAPILKVNNNQAINTPKFLLIGICIALLLPITLIIHYLTKGESKTQLSQLETPKEITIFQGIENHPAIDSKGEKLAFSWRQFNRPGQIYIKNLADRDTPIRLLSNSNNDQIAPAWSPDNERIAFIEKTANNGCQIVIQDLASMRPDIITDDCVYSGNRSNLDWSKDGRYLLFGKVMAEAQALFRFDLQSKHMQQMSFPENSEKDVLARFAKNSDEIVFIRQGYQQAQIIHVAMNTPERIVVDNKDSIIGLTWDAKGERIYTNILEKGSYHLYKLNVDSLEHTVLKQIQSPANLSFDSKNNRLFYAQYNTKEHISQRTISDGQEINRVSSSYRDMYGSYSVASSDIIFMSNRDKNWDVWRRSGNKSMNLTKGLGTTLQPKISPSGDRFIATIKPKHESIYSLYIGDVEGKTLNPIVLPGMEPTALTWGQTDNDIYFANVTGNSPGIYHLQLSTGTLTKVSDQQVKSLFFENQSLYVSKETAVGVWKIDLKSQTESQVNDTLAQADYGSYFILDDNLYYLKRDNEYDYVIRQNQDATESIINRFPRGSVRKYFGLSPADEHSYLLTLNNIPDADINMIQFSG
ncbi:winged helix-turn-helix domain-containing protein [Thalassotalea sp. Y01]|uniref:winged helix-turn-helix domain-containing protein n=1 Tax=Thalassotalea sp. Y01 TaxID=2729613 RepID=UPI00145CE32E|nr:winged helix-turn-helix domain-containing protein [Thalassotalea sp. Y01]NMP16657.1 hypothetical protein [Thalassotalea sp. Y01]